MDAKQKRRALEILLIACLVAVAFLHLLKPVGDPDFFWHIKTGEWIWQNKSLPQADLFTFTEAGNTSALKRFALTSYWLSQVSYYLFYLAGGMGAIVALRWAIVLILAYFMLKQREGDGLVYLCLLTMFLVFLLTSYSIERPHVFSFVFFAILLYLLYSIRNEVSGERPFSALLYIPLLMFIWANTHGGYVLGQTTILLFIAMEGIKFVNPVLRPLKRGTYKRLLIAGLSGLAFSLANPNTYHAVEIFRLAPQLKSVNIEYQTTLYAFRKFGNPSLFLYWFMLFLTACCAAFNIRRPDITKLALLAGTGFFSFTQVRFGPFFWIAALPYVGSCLSGEKIRRFSRVFFMLTALSVAVFFTRGEYANLRNFISGNWIRDDSAPVGAADFIIKNDLRGRMFNHYNLGGYLIWRLAPERKVFIYGGSLYDAVFSQAQLIDLGFADTIAGMPFWKSCLQAYGVRYVVVPFLMPSGELSPLIFALQQDNDWLPVFADPSAVIFVKDSYENKHVTGKYSIPKELFIDRLIELCDRMLISSPDNVLVYVAKGDLYMKKAMFKEARAMFEKALRISPSNSTAMGKLRLLSHLYSS